VVGVLKLRETMLRLNDAGARRMNRFRREQRRLGGGALELDASLAKQLSGLVELRPE
jgi:hypothetical protein